MPDTENTNPPQPHPAVLLVEDNPIMAAILGKILSKMTIGYAVAADGMAAIEACKGEEYSLVLMDINMPKMNGMRATEKIRTLGPHYETSPIIAVTANLDPDDVKAYKAAGMTDYIKKPVNQIDLKRIVAEYLGKSDDDAISRDDESALQMEAMGEDEMDALNWETLREYSGIMKAEFPKLLASYLRAGPDMMDKLAEAVFDDHLETVAFLSHKLKSTSVVFGAESVTNLAAQLEERARADDMKGAKLVFNELHLPFERTNAVLRKRLTLMKMGM